jgi:hypothetical protein
MYWNHRLVDLSKDNEGEPWIVIQEVYYNEENKPCGYCDPCMGGEDLSEVMQQVKRFSECLNQPILNAETDFNNKLTEDDEEGKEYV